MCASFLMKDKKTTRESLCRVITKMFTSEINLLEIEERNSNLRRSIYKCRDRYTLGLRRIQK